MAVVAVVDLYAALTARLRASSEIQAVVSDRISMELRAGWENTSCVVVSQAGGATDDYPPLAVARIAVRCFAPKYLHDAMNLRRLVHAYLTRPDGGATGFKQGACIVHSVQHEGGPLPVPEFMGSVGRIPFPAIYDTYRVVYCEVAVP